ncbi:MAG: HPF/RaiA family ribosome-associated protein [Phycisphaerae bacterium]|nr:HPF/RaiA family ribosome-associated protein [Phycisphaerae bacterium]
MELEIFGRKVLLDDAARLHVERKLEYALNRFEKRITQVTVRLADVNGPRGGVDKICAIEVTVRPRGLVHVEERGDDLHAVIATAADKAGRAVRRELDRRKDRTKSAARRASVKRTGAPRTRSRAAS